MAQAGWGRATWRLAARGQVSGGGAGWQAGRDGAAALLPPCIGSEGHGVTPAGSRERTGCCGLAAAPVASAGRGSYPFCYVTKVFPEALKTRHDFRGWVGALPPLRRAPT